jgi:hypothetical protein
VHGPDYLYGSRCVTELAQDCVQYSSVVVFNLQVLLPETQFTYLLRWLISLLR